jgi:hypothetical protein
MPLPPLRDIPPSPFSGIKRVYVCDFDFEFEIFVKAFGLLIYWIQGYKMIMYPLNRKSNTNQWQYLYLYL